jgi:hypothetical protein
LCLLHYVLLDFAASERQNFLKYICTTVAVYLFTSFFSFTHLLSFHLSIYCIFFHLFIYYLFIYLFTSFFLLSIYYLFIYLFTLFFSFIHLLPFVSFIFLPFYSLILGNVPGANIPTRFNNYKMFSSSIFFFKIFFFSARFVTVRARGRGTPCLTIKRDPNRVVDRRKLKLKLKLKLGTRSHNLANMSDVVLEDTLEIRMLAEF